mgnify:CR=1 FL=1
METFDRAIRQLKQLPGIGKKSAQRLIFHLLKISDQEVEKLSDVIRDVNDSLQTCQRCFGLSEQKQCPICRDTERNPSVLAVVAHPEDIFTLEDSGEFDGRYHVLRGLISPLDGIGPEQLTIGSLLERIRGDEPIEELIFAFNPTNEGEVTMNYLQKRLKSFSLKLTHLGYGIPVGSDIGYTDQMTLSRAFENRVSLSEQPSTP